MFFNNNTSVLSLSCYSTFCMIAFIWNARSNLPFCSTSLFWPNFYMRPFYSFFCYVSSSLLLRIFFLCEMSKVYYQPCSHQPLVLIHLLHFVLILKCLFLKQCCVSFLTFDISFLFSLQFYSEFLNTFLSGMLDYFAI